MERAEAIVGLLADLYAQVARLTAERDELRTALVELRAQAAADVAVDDVG